ncbi:MAG: branched-chain amino acid ABC transporter permease [Anaerolineae bacterium]
MQGTRKRLGDLPLLAWFFGALVAVTIEYFVGNPLARVVGLSKAPALFGLRTVVKSPLSAPGALVYVLLMYALPVGIAASLVGGFANRLARRLLDLSFMVSLVVHLALLYAALHLWASSNEYRLLVVRLSFISVMVTLSLNVVNGYLGEFSCSHPGFMALGAYTASVVTVLFFVDDDVFGAPLLPPALGPFAFPIALAAGGLVAAVGALLVAIPSFRTRGDYLAIISLAFTFIVKSLIENLEVVGGPRGFMNQPQWATLPAVFVSMVVCVAIIYNYVRSTLGKATCAVRDDETAAGHLTVNTRRTKMVAFLFAAFWAGAAGGLLAHVLGYINPGDFGLLRLSEVLAMVYFGGLNSVVGSIVGAITIQVVGEVLRPLQILKWIVFPVIIILFMMFRPTGLIAFTEVDVRDWLAPRAMRDDEVE